jgi:transposase-like protein
MLKIPVRAWILNAAAVFSGRHGAVSRQAEQSGCSRQTVYQHARKLEQRLGDAPPPQTPADEPPRPAAVDTPKPPTGPLVLLDKDKLKQLTTTAFAMGVSLRQVEGLLGVLLPADEVPDHSISALLLAARSR